MAEEKHGAAEWADLKNAFAGLVDLPPSERTSALEHLARGKPDLAARLKTLLEADASADERLFTWERAVSGPATAATADMDPLGLVGETIGHFRVEEILGRGGMGIAYRALDTRLDRPVALKFLLPRETFDAGAKNRLLHEARAASTLDHPNVCTIFEVGETSAGLFFAMPAYTGETLRDRIAREGPLPPATALGLTGQLLRGLAAAHAAGITHRDLKPGNLIITADGTLKILDFGLATVRDFEDASPATTPGTMAYMSPEQLSAEPVNHRTDLWSAGVVLHELLTGKPPFGGGSSLGTPWSILHDDPPSAGHGPQLDAFIAKLLARKPENRFASAGAALAALEELTRASGDTATGQRPRRIAGVAALVATLLTGGWLFLRAIESRAGATDLPSVAVLPFSDTESDSARAYLGEGLAEEVLDALAQVPGLRVPGRRSSFAERNRDVVPAELARMLGVRTLLRGTIERSGDRVRVEASLVDGATDAPLWSDRWDRPLDEIGTVRSDIVAGVSDALGVEHTVVSPPASPDFAAYELYLRGRFYWNRRTPRDLALAIDFFEQATRRDSAWAPPWAGLALAWAVLPALAGESNDLLVRAEDAAARALALDSTLADAWAARGYALHWQWRWTEAETAFQRAIAINPANSVAHEWYGEHLAKMGRTVEGERMVRRAIDLDPLALVARNDLGIVLMLSHRFDEAIAQFEEVIRADPAFAPPHLLETRVYLVMGDAEAAAEAGRRAGELMRTSDPDDLVLLARATADSSLRDGAVAVLDRWARRPSPPWPDIAMYFSLLGEHDRAIDALHEALRAHSPHLAGLRVAPWLDPLRPDPRFQEILNRLAFPPVQDPPDPSVSMAGRSGTF